MSLVMKRWLIVLTGVLGLALIALVAWRIWRVREQQHRNNALWEAVEKGDLYTVTTLLDRGADPNTSEYDVLDRRYRTTIPAALMRLIGREPRYNIDPATNKYTADPRVDGNWATRQKWNTVLWLATHRGRADIVRALVAKSARDESTGYLQTALMWAAEEGYKDIVESLIANGSDVNATDDFGYTALDGAVMRGEMEIAEILLRNGANGDKHAWPNAEARGSKVSLPQYPQRTVASELPER